MTRTARRLRGIGFARAFVPKMRELSRGDAIIFFRRILVERGSAANLCANARQGASDERGRFIAFCVPAQIAGQVTASSPEPMRDIDEIGDFE
jgi:hypothetical protein